MAAIEQPASRPLAAGADDERVDFRRLLEQLERDGTLAGDGALMVVRRHHNGAGLGRDPVAEFLAARLRSVISYYVRAVGPGSL